MFKETSHHQKRIWFIDKFESGKLYESHPTYHNIPLLLEVKRIEDIQIIEQALNEVIFRHSAMHIRFVVQDEEPFQEINKEFKFSFNEIALNGETEKREEAIKKALKFNEKPFSIYDDDLVRGVYIQIDKSHFIVCLSFHHIIADRYSIDILRKEFELILDSKIRNINYELNDSKLDYLKFSKWQLSLPKNVIDSQLFYWKRKLKGKIQTLELPMDFHREAIHIYKPGRINFEIQNSVSQKITSLCKSLNISENIFFLSIYKILLLRFSGLSEIAIGTSYSNRNQKELSDLFGPISNLIVLRSFIDKKQSVKDLLKEINKLYSEATKHGIIPFDLLSKILRPATDMSRTVFFDVLYNFEEYSKTEINDSHFELDVIETNLGIGKYDLNLLIKKHKDLFEGILVYNTCYFTQETVSHMVDCFVELINSSIENINNSIEKLPILSLTSEKELLNHLNNTDSEYPEEKLVHEMFEEQVMKKPDSVALVFEDIQITYRELNEQSNFLAAKLINEHGIENNDLVGILLERSEHVIIAILAVVKSGAVYVPIDPSNPSERINYIIEDSKLKILLSDKRTNSSLLDEIDGTILEIDNEFNTSEYKDSIKSNNPGQNNDPLYIIYTSGTSGLPKGCLVSHKNVIRLMINDDMPLEINNNDNWIMAHSYSFDFSVWEIYGALLYGGKLVIPEINNIRDTRKFYSLILRNQISILNQTPVAFYNLIDEQKRQNNKILSKQLKYVCFGGERLEPAYLIDWVNYYPLSDIRLINMYGITETTVHVTYHYLTNEEVFNNQQYSPIGKPLPETKVFLFDENLQIVPYCVHGEMYIGGTGVALGYLNRPELTHERFIKNPYNSDEIIYKSGDVARKLVNKDLEYIGRNDHQVKIRGFRIELEEIEKVILKNEEIEKVIVISDFDEDQDAYLIAYYISNEEIDEAIIISLQKDYLPDYMIPKHHIHLKKFPLNSSGKIDKQKLPKPSNKLKENDAYALPTNDLQVKILKIWKDVLKIDKIGINDDFFSIGGDSIKGIRVVNRIQDELNEIIHIALLFQNPTIKQFTEKIEGYKNTDNDSVNEEDVLRLREIIKPLPKVEIQNKIKKEAVFILAPFRSGSTLLRIILAGHEKLFAPPELELLSFNTLQERKKLLKGTFLEEGTARAIKELKNCSPQEALELMTYFEQENISTADFYKYITEWCEGKVLIDKTPSYTFDKEILNKAEDLFEEPKYIHLVRNPNAVIRSFIEAKIDQVFRYKHDFTLQQLAELIWIICHQNTLQFLESIPENRKHLVYFEDLVMNPKDVVRGICKFIGVEFTQSMIDIYQNSNTRMTDGIFPESKMIGDVKFFTHKKIDASIANNWKKNNENISLSDITKNLAIKLGYKEFKNKLTRIEQVTKAKYYNLSHAQKRLWILDQFKDHNNSYIIPNGYQIIGDLDINILSESIKFIIKRHEILRTNFVLINDEPKQVISESAYNDFKIDYHDLKNTDKEKQEIVISNIVEDEVATEFNLENDLLLRCKIIHVENNEYLLLITTHHIIFDGWSSEILYRELQESYTSLSNNTPNNLPDLAIQYKDFTEWQNLQLSQDTEGHKDFWHNNLAGELPVISFPSDYSRPNIKTFNGNTLDFTFKNNLSIGIKELVKKNGVSLFSVLVAFLNTLILKYTNDNDIIIGAPSAGREHPDLEHQIGFYINTMVLRTVFEKNIPFTEFLTQVADNTKNVIEHQAYPFDKLIDELDIPKDVSRAPLFDIMIVLQNNEQAVSSLSDLTIESYKVESKISKFDLMFSFVEVNQKISLNIEYNTDIFKQERIVRIFNHFENLVQSVIEDPNCHLDKLQILSLEEKSKILYDFNKTEQDYDLNITLSELFEKQVEKTPDNIAIFSDNRNISYAELNTQANKLALSLRKLGVKAGSLVSILTGRSIEMITGVFAILKSGGAYVPIEPNLPEARIHRLLKELNVEIIISDSLRLEKIGKITDDISSVSHIVILDEPNNKETQQKHFTNKQLLLPLDIEHNSPDNLKQLSKSDDIAYIIFTSGSTGIPKGVVEQHKPVVNVIEWINKTSSVTEKDKLLFIASLSFDLSVYDIFGILSTGASIRLLSNEEIKDPNRILDTLLNEEITIWDSAPAALQQLVPLFPDKNKNNKLRLVMLSGDWIPLNLPEKLKEIFEGVNVLSLGGATEATIWSNYYPIGEINPAWNSIPYGKPIQNAKYYILDSNLGVCLTGVPGDLYIGGECLALGYINDLELSTKKFINNPFVSGEKIYKTGDLARFMDDGNIEFLGRKDNQVKIRGFRIELGEIESVLQKHKTIKESIVLAREENGNKYLCAYIVHDEEFNEEEIRTYLTQQLPDYMVPSFFVTLNEIPLTSNGKLDRKSLPSPEVNVGIDYVEPQNELEIRMLEIWEKVLDIEVHKIGTTINFFNIGGHSLRAINLISKIHKILNIKVDLAIIFKYPTIKQLCNYIKDLNPVKFTSIKPTEDKEYFPLSSAQNRMYFIQRRYKDTTAYNIPQAFLIEGSIDKDKLSGFLDIIIKENECLRTSFNIIDNKPKQIIHNNIKSNIEYIEANESDVTEILKNSIKTFDLSKAPLFRITLIKTGELKHILLIDMHHIIADGVSLKILSNEFLTLISGNQISNKNIRYRDYINWQEDLRKEGVIDKQKEYWLNIFSKNNETLNLPYDYNPDSNQELDGSKIVFKLDNETANTLSEFIKEFNITAYMLFLAIFNILLSRICNQSQIITGSPIAGRRHSDLNQIIGMFVNMIVLKNEVASDLSFKEFVMNVKNNSINAIENQDYQYDELINDLTFSGSENNSLFNVSYAFENFNPVEEANPSSYNNYRISEYSNSQAREISKYELSLYGAEGDNTFHFQIHYRKNLFKQETINKIKEYFLQIVSMLSKDKKIKIGDINLNSKMDYTLIESSLDSSSDFSF